VNGGVNSIGQRKGVRTNFNLGGAHTANPGDTSWSYDNLGQLTSANHGSNNNIDRAYQYDTIGNRLFAENGAAQIPTTPGLNTTGYTPDALNQYNAITAYNASGVAETPVVPVFDDDGNMTQGPLPVSPSTNCTLVWDAENRLIEVRSASNVTLVKYAYDALSRRVSRSVSASPNSYTLYLYDGWNCIAEWNANPQSVTLTSTRTWGLDLSSTPQGAGGVGGLLSEKQSNNTFYPTYDGNGNISEYLAADGSTAAHYEYDPFGNIVKESYASGYNASSFNYKFSTKPLDQATGLYYYGYRYYDPKTGRWPSRDPIGEEGGINLYGFVGNDAIRFADILGLKTIDVEKCEAYLFIGHGGKTNPIKWNLNGACSLGGAVSCFPNVNQPKDKFESHRKKPQYPSDNLWPNVPTHDALTTAGGLGEITAGHNSRQDAVDRGFDVGDPRSEHNSKIAIKKALDSIGAAVHKLCRPGGCCDEVKITVEIGNDKATNSFIENTVEELDIPLGGRNIDDDNETYTETFRCPGK
jgi:RHS repeat-associated protein